MCVCVCLWQMVGVPHLSFAKISRYGGTQRHAHPCCLLSDNTGDWLTNQHRKSACFATFLIAEHFKFMTTRTKRRRKKNTRPDGFLWHPEDKTWQFHVVFDFSYWQSGRCAHSQGFSGHTMSLWWANTQDSDHNACRYYDTWEKN